MSPRDDLKYGETDYVLAKPGDCYIAYASGITTSLGIRKGQNESIFIQLLYDDPDSSPGPYTISIVKQPGHGSLSGTGNDQTYTPNRGFSGKDSFEWIVNDWKDDSNIATVTIQCILSSQGKPSPH